jgi:hypothetical protein
MSCTLLCSISNITFYFEDFLGTKLGMVTRWLTFLGSLI